MPCLNKVIKFWFSQRAPIDIQCAERYIQSCLILSLRDRDLAKKCILNIEMQCFMICKDAVINVSLAFSCRFQCEYLGTIFRQTLTAFCILCGDF